MGDDIEDINTLLNREHCKSSFDLSQHYNSFLSTNSAIDKSSFTLNQMDTELKSIFEEIAEDENPPAAPPQVEPRAEGRAEPFFDGYKIEDDVASVVSDISHHSTAVPIASTRIKSALKSYSDVLDVELDYDNTKYVLLEEIDEFQEQLILDEILPGKKYNVNVNTPLTELRSVREMLKIKYDKSRFTNTGIKTIELAAYVLEKIFDGTRSIGSFTLNLTGWHKTMKLKTKYLRTDISECVETYISPTMTPGTRIFFDIFLNMIFYGTTNHISKNMRLQDAFEKLSKY